MKPCSGNQKLIAWLAVDALDARSAAALRDHLALCENCHRYWEELTHVTDALGAAAPDSSLQASERFHRRLAEKLQPYESSSVLEQLAAWFRGVRLNWRVTLPVLAALVFALFATLALRHPSAVSPLRPLAVQVVSESSTSADPTPTLANYQRVACRSLDELSELLTRQGNRSLPPAPVYTVSGLAPGHAPF